VVGAKEGFVALGSKRGLFGAPGMDAFLVDYVPVPVLSVRGTRERLAIK
jgi:hypothetical protein